MRNGACSKWILASALVSLCIVDRAAAEANPAEEFARLERLLIAGRYAEAERGAREFLPQVETSRGRYSLETAHVLDLLVEARLRMGPEQLSDPMRGEPLRVYAQRAVSIKQRVLRHDDPDIATSLINFGTVVLQEREPAEALLLFRTALQIREQALGRDHALVGESLYYVGLAATDKDDTAQAREAFEEALRVWEGAAGPTHSSVERCLAKLAELAWEAGDFDEAARYYTRNLDLLEELYGLSHPQIAFVRNRLASLSLTTGARRRARDLGVPDVQELVLLQHRVLGAGHGRSWHEDYQKGERAFQEQDWQQSIKHLVHSIEKRARPEVEARVPERGTVAYHPFLKLGIAYYNLGRFDLALAAFDDEERLGAITRNSAELSNLRTFRELADRAIAGESAEQSVTGLIDKGLARARALEDEGRLDEALGVLGRVLAAAPESSRVNSAMEHVRVALAKREQALELEQRVARLAREGADLLAAGEYETASSVLSQAMSLKPSARIQSLLDESQRKLVQRVSAERDAKKKQQLVREGMREAEGLQRTGNLREALSKLQSVLAVDAKNREALRLRDHLLQLQQEVDARRSRSETVARLLDEGLALVGEGDNEQAADRFSRVLALDPTNESAGRLLRSALGGLAPVDPGSLLAGPKIPPIIVLANLAAAVGDSGAAEEHTNRSVFTISGIIDDDQPEIRLTIRETSGRDPSGHRFFHEATLTSENKRGALYRYQFQHSMKLRPGAQTIAVAAGDTDGLSSQIVHRVRYVRPLYRSPWFYAAFGLLALAGVVGARGYRLRRRRRLLRRRFNPYAAGTPILDEKLFFGRDALLSRIIQTVPNNSLLLFGERRIGKTSLQHHLKRRLEQMDDPVYQFFPIYIDLEGTPQDRFFATLAHDVFDQLSPVLDGKKPPRDPATDPDYGYHNLVRDIRGVLRQLRQRSEKKIKLVLLIDEVDELNYYDPRINQKLRSLFMKSFAEDLTAVVSGVGIKKDWEREGSPWFNFFEEVPVEPFEDADARELIEQPIRGVFEFEDGVVDRIIERSGRRPYLIQKLCVAIVNHMHEEGRQRITLADVERVDRTVGRGGK